MSDVCCMKCGGDILTGPALCCGCAPALAERADAAERENATLREIINLVLNIPRMTDAQLAELVANCKIALAAPSAPKEPTR